MNASNQNIQKKSLSSQQPSQDNLNKINQQFQELSNKNNINEQNFQLLKNHVQGIDSKITQIQNKPFNLFEPTTLWPICLAAITALFVNMGTLFYTNYVKNKNDQKDSKKLILYFIEANKNILIALSVELEKLKRYKKTDKIIMISNDFSYTPIIQSCKEYIELLNNRKINQDILLSSKSFDKKASDKLVRYFFDLDIIFVEINLLILNHFFKDKNGDHRLFDTNEYNDYFAEQRIDSFETLTRYFFELDAILFNLTFAEFYSNSWYYDYSKKTQYKLNKLNGDVNHVRTQLSEVICQSFDILKSFDPEYFEDKFEKNTDEFRDQVYRFWDKKNHDDEKNPSFPLIAGSKYEKDFPELKTYLEKNKESMSKNN